MFTLNIDRANLYNTVSDNVFTESIEHDCLLSDLTAICEWHNKCNTLIFKFGGLGQLSWPVDILFDLPHFLEQANNCLQALHNKTNFKLEFPEQGIERTVIFSFQNDAYLITAINYNNAKGNEGFCVMDHSGVFNMFKLSLYNFIIHSNKNHYISNLPYLTNGV